MAFTITHDWTEYLSLEQLRQLLGAGKLEIPSEGGTLRLLVQERDRAKAQEFLLRP
jgi:hypothetical protein